MAEESREYNKVVEYIKVLLTEEKISIGDRLPTERAISETLSISRNSTREALRVLENMGMVESRQGSGNFLVGDIGKNIVNSLNMMLFIKSTNQLEISQFRRYIELASFNIAIDINTNIDTSGLENMLNKMENAQMMSDRVCFDKKFHDFIICASNNQLMISIMDAFSEICESFVGQMLSCTDEDKKKRLAKAHRSIFQSIADKNKASGIQAINEHYDIIEELIKTQ